MKYVLLLATLLLSACANSDVTRDSVTDDDRADFRAYHMMRERGERWK